jgi:hypothetical protein
MISIPGPRQGEGEGDRPRRRIGSAWLVRRQPAPFLLRTSMTPPVLLLERRLDVRECRVVACSFFKSSMLVMLDRFIWPLAVVRLGPDARSRAKSSLVGLSDFALGWLGRSSWGPSVPAVLSCIGDTRDADEPCSWLDIGEKSGLLGSGRRYCGTSLEESWKTGESAS